MAKGKVLQTIIDIAGEISPTLGKSLDSVSKSLEGVNLKAIAAGAAIGGLAAGTAVAIGKAGVALGKMGDTYNSAINNISAGTGLVGQELEGMSDVIKDVYGSNFADSMEDAAAGITEVYRATGLTDEALGETTKAAYALSETFGYDVAESARAAKAMMTNFGVSGEEAMGLIAAGAQNGLDYSGELIDSISEYSVQFSKLGFSADDMFNIFQQGADSGAWNLDKVGDAVKEFSIRSIDGSKTTTEAFSALGYNADEMMATFAAGGEGAEMAFQDVLKSLIEMDDAVQRDALGVSLFGTQWEDLGVEAMSSLLDVKDEAYNTEDALGKINAVKYDNIQDAIGGIKREAEVALMPLASSISDALMDVMPAISSMISSVGPLVEQLIPLLMPLVEDFLSEVVSFLQLLLPQVIEFASAILPILVQVIGTLFDTITPLLPVLLDLVSSLLPLALSLIQALVPVIELVFDVLGPVLGLVSDLLIQLLPPLTQILNALTPIIQFLAVAIGSVLGGALSSIEPLLFGVISIFQNLIDFITNVFTGNWEGAWDAVVGIFVDIFNLIPNTVEFVLNAAIDLINGIIEGINSVSSYVGMEIALIPKVDLPAFATGGITDGISIAGEDPRYPNEYIISLNPAYRKQNLSYWAEAGRMLGADMSDFNLAGGSGSQSVSLSGVTFAPNITIAGSANKDDIIQAIKDEYPEFVDMLEEFLLNRGMYAYG